MKMRESEIFNEYAKLARDAGLVSDDDIKKEADEKVRYDSRSFTDIEALYGHKMGPNNGQSIVDLAHPDTVVVGPAYDAMNAVIENGHQRHDIMSYIALKDPDGHLVQRRYVKASDKLVNSLISTGFAMDNANEEKLMRLADSCAGRLRKEGALPFIAIGIGVAALAGINWYFTQAEIDVQNINANADIVINELSDLSGESYAPEITRIIGDIKNANMGYLNNMRQLNELGRGVIVAARAGDINTIEAIHSQGEPLMQQLNDTTTKLQQLSQDLITEKATVSSETGQQESMPSWQKKLLNIKDTMFGSDSNDLLLAMDAQSRAINEAMVRANSAISSFKSRYGAAIAGKIEQVKMKDIPNDLLEPIPVS